jgi:hypothetical protein
LHVIQRGNNRQPIFFCQDDYRYLHAWLAKRWRFMTAPSTLMC